MNTSTTITLGICADTHGEALPTWPDQRLDAVLHAGDVYDAPRLAQGYDYVSPRSWAQTLGAPVLAVRGNHDFRDPDGFFMVAEDVSGRVVRLSQGLWVAGVGFAPSWYCDTPGDSDLESQCRDLTRMVNRLVMPGERIILLTHYPPRVMELVGRGTPATWSYQRVGELAEILRPVAIIFGHQHDWFGRHWRRADGTLLVSPGPRGGVLTIAAHGEATFMRNDASSIDPQ